MFRTNMIASYKNILMINQYKTIFQCGYYFELIQELYPLCSCSRLNSLNSFCHVALHCWVPPLDGANATTALFGQAMEWKWALVRFFQTFVYFLKCRATGRPKFFYCSWKMIYKGRRRSKLNSTVHVRPI